jgi:hypothetical protein
VTAILREAPKTGEDAEVKNQRQRASFKLRIEQIHRQSKGGHQKYQRDEYLPIEN